MGRVVIELYKHVVPLSAENFRRLCVGLDLGETAPMRFLSYKGTKFHKVLPTFICQGGDVIANDGSNGMSIYGKTFADENFTLPVSKSLKLTHVLLTILSVDRQRLVQY